ncbi:hypothetical protein Droror1_Dr00021040 [Drosera rotundifolia]
MWKQLSSISDFIFCSCAAKRNSEPKSENQRRRIGIHKQKPITCNHKNCLLGIDSSRNANNHFASRHEADDSGMMRRPTAAGWGSRWWRRDEEGGCNLVDRKRRLP